MEKIIKIGDKSITFKATAGTLRRYREQFGRDYIVDSLNMGEKAESGINKEYFEMLENISWAMAKTANPETPSPEAFFDSFGIDEFTYDLIVKDILPIMSAQYDSISKN